MTGAKNFDHKHSFRQAVKGQLSFDHVLVQNLRAFYVRMMRSLLFVAVVVTTTKLLLFFFFSFCVLPFFALSKNFQTSFISATIWDNFFQTHQTNVSFYTPSTFTNLYMMLYLLLRNVHPMCSFLGDWGVLSSSPVVVEK